MDTLLNNSSQNNKQGETILPEATPPARPAEKSHKKSDARGGRGRKASPELTRAVHDVQASETRLKHDIARLNGDKERLTEQVDDLEKRIAVAKEEGLLKSTIKRLEALLTEAHDKLKILEGILPAESNSRDRALMEDVLKKWKEYEHERTNQARAESKINQSPEDKRAEGDFNRARTAAHMLKEEIHALVKQGDLIVGNSTPSPVHDEWVSYTREQARVEGDVLAKKHKESTAVSPVFEDKNDEKIAVEVAPETVPPVPSVPDIHPTTTDTDIHPIITDGVIIEEPKEVDASYIAKYEDGDAAWDLAQQQLEISNEKNFVIQPETQQTPLIVPEEVMVWANTESSIKKERSFVEQVEQPKATAIEQPSPEILAERVEQNIPSPEEITLDEQKVRTYAEEQVHTHINELFGKKGFLGFGWTEGMDSLDWNDPQVGFADKTVTEIMEIDLEGLPRDGKKHFGVGDYEATNKMQEYLKLALHETTVQPEHEEKTEDYLRRASAVIIGKFMKKE